MRKSTIPALSLAALLFGAGGFTAATATGEVGTPTTPPDTNVCLADFMNDDQDAQWDKLQVWLEGNYATQSSESSPDCVTLEPTPEPTTDPTTEPEPTTDPTTDPEPTAPADEGPTLTDHTVVATDDNKIILEGTITGTTGEVTFRASANPLTGQAGYPTHGTPAEDGTIRLEVTDFNNTDPQFWQIEEGGSTYTYGEVFADGEVGTPTTDPTTEPTTDPEPTAPATGGDSTGGSGGALADDTFQTFAANGISSEYHIYAADLDWTQPVGVIMYADGSGGHGFDNPGQSYLIGGSNGLAAVAQKHNMILVVPEAPAPGCDGYDNCWYNQSGSPTPAQKAAWSSALLDQVKGDYDISLDRIVTGGYSSGSQWHRWFLPAHGEAQSVDLSVMITYGGAPAVQASYSDAFKQDVALVWNNGTNDSSYTTASYGSLGGYQWYKDQGFTNVTHTDVPGEDHSRDGQFGGIVDRAITDNNI